MSTLKRFLRYNGRHGLYFPRDGKMPQLNPICSSSHSKGGKRTFRLDEPLWLFRLRQRAFAFAGHHRCGDRGIWAAFNGEKPLPDTWDIGPDGNRTCSFCGSIHAHDLMAICRKTLVDDRYGVEGTTKNYKAYVRQPGVQNAGQGAIKFYMWHAPAQPSADDQKLFDDAKKITHERIMARFSPMPR